MQLLYQNNIDIVKIKLCHFNSKNRTYFYLDIIKNLNCVISSVGTYGATLEYIGGQSLVLKIDPIISTRIKFVCR
mgnify:CR=1 FL=1